MYQNVNIMSAKGSQKTKRCFVFVLILNQEQFSSQNQHHIALIHQDDLLPSLSVPFINSGMFFKQVAITKITMSDSKQVFLHTQVTYMRFSYSIYELRSDSKMVGLRLKICVDLLFSTFKAEQESLVKLIKKET